MELITELSMREQLASKYDIDKFVSTGLAFSSKNQKWYGYSHRAVCGFGIGDKVFDAEYGDDSTPYSKHGTVTIENMKQAKQAAENFADYVG